MEKINLLHFVINIMYTYTIYLMVTTFQKEDSKFDKKFQFCAYLAFYFMLTSVYSFFNIPILTIVVNMLGLFGISFLYSNKIIQNLQISIVVYTILVLEDLVLAFITNNKLFNMLQTRQHVSIISLFIGNIIFLLTALCLKNIFKTRFLRKKIMLAPLFSTVISSITILIALILITKVDMEMKFFLLIISLLLLINLFSVWGGFVKKNV